MSHRRQLLADNHRARPRAARAMGVAAAAVSLFDDAAAAAALAAAGMSAAAAATLRAAKRSVALQIMADRYALKVPVFGDLIRKSSIARWTRTLSTMFAAGVPLVEALDSVGGAAGNFVYLKATERIQQEVSTGTSLTAAMGNANLFPTMVLQMCAIGEESGSIDHMLGKAAAGVMSLSGAAAMQNGLNYISVRH